VQTILPLLLTAVRDGWLTLGEVLRVTSSGPAAVYGIAGKGAIAPGMDGDLTLVDPDETRQLPLEWLRSRAGYSPYVGTPLNGWPHTTILRGAVVYREHMAVGAAIGRPVSFAGG
jgi:dihydroorotase